MRILVTGAGNPYGRAIVQKLLAQGHQVRIFGGQASDLKPLEPFAKGTDALNWIPGEVSLGGSIEPALSERQALIHAAGLDAVGKDKHAHAVHVERGARYARFGAEREQVDDFIVVTPADPPRAFAAAHAAEAAEAALVRGVINQATVRAGSDPDATADEVVGLVGKLPELGKQPGRDTDAVTA